MLLHYSYAHSFMYCPLYIFCCVWLLLHWNSGVGLSRWPSHKEPIWQWRKEMEEMWVRSLGWEDPPEEGMATHSSVLAWRILWTEEPGGPHRAGVSESNKTKRSTTAARRGSSHTLRWKRSPAWKKTLSWQVPSRWKAMDFLLVPLRTFFSFL